MDPADICQAPDLRTRTGDGDAGLAQVQMHDLGVAMFELLGQINGRVARAATGHQRPETVAEGLLSGEAVMVDHGQVVQPCLCEPRALVFRVAGGIRQSLVLASHFGKVVVGLAHGSWRQVSHRGRLAREPVHPTLMQALAPCRQRITGTQHCLRLQNIPFGQKQFLPAHDQ